MNDTKTTKPEVVKLADGCYMVTYKGADITGKRYADEKRARAAYTQMRRFCPDLPKMEPRDEPEPVVWKMPKWMERYRESFQNTGGNSIEDLMNDYDNNVVRAGLIVSVDAQVTLLFRLAHRGLLVGVDPETLQES